MYQKTIVQLILIPFFSFVLYTWRWGLSEHLLVGRITQTFLFIEIWRSKRRLRRVGGDLEQVLSWQNWIFKEFCLRWRTELCVTVVPLLCNSRDSQTRNVLNVAVWWPGQLCQYMTVICFDSWVIFHNCQLFARCESWSNNLILLVVEICDNNGSCISDSSENMSLLLWPVTVLSNILHLFQCFSCKNIDSCVNTWQLLCRCLTVHVQICDCQADM